MLAVTVQDPLDFTPNLFQEQTLERPFLNTLDQKEFIVSEFYMYVKDILHFPKLKQLKNLLVWNSRIIGRVLGKSYLKKVSPLNNYKIHSFRVSMLAYLLGKMLGADEEVCARAGLLHDVAKIESGKKMGIWRYVIGDGHSGYGAKILKKIGESKKVVNAVRCHKFPFTNSIPKSKEDWIVLIADRIDGFYRYRNTISCLFK